MLKSKHYCSPNSDRPIQKEFTTENTPIQSFPVKYCPPCVIALHHFVDYTGQAFHRVNFLTGQADITEKDKKNI